MTKLLAPTEEERIEFDDRLVVATATEAKAPNSPRYIDGKLVAWAPQEGSQEEFLSCPLFECLFHGTRGPGKTDALIMDFAQDVGKGFGESWRGIIFRESYPQLADVVAKSTKWFRQTFPSARFVQSGQAGRGMAWHFETGESLLFRWMKDPRDYWNYHGHEYPWIGWEELTNWANDECYKSMFACCRSSTPGIPRKIRGTTNPYGVGHQWVKDRFNLSGQWWKTQVVEDSLDHNGKLEPPRAAIHGHLNENKILLAADPNYKQTIAAAATSKAMADAWENGSWDIVAGGMFDDVWRPSHNIVPRFEIPESWRMDRSFDWGSSKPFSVGWWARSDGSDLLLSDGRVMATVRGDLFRVYEWYGYTGKANQGLRMLAVEVAEGIVERELLKEWRAYRSRKSRVKPGPADSSIYSVEDGVSIAGNMERPVRIGGHVYPGVSWTPADKRAGSRKSGWEQMRDMIRQAQPPKGGGPREHPGLFVVGDECKQWLRTVLSLPRDDKDMDDVNTDAEDHAADETRYRVRSGTAVFKTRRTVGNY